MESRPCSPTFGTRLLKFADGFPLDPLRGSFPQCFLKTKGLSFLLSFSARSGPPRLVR